MGIQARAHCWCASPFLALPLGACNLKLRSGLEMCDRTYRLLMRRPGCDSCTKADQLTMCAFYYPSTLLARLKAIVHTALGLVRKALLTVVYVFYRTCLLGVLGGWENRESMT